MNLPDYRFAASPPISPASRFTRALAFAAVAACAAAFVLAGCGDKVAAPLDAGKSAPAVPVLTANVEQKRMPLRLHAIGNVETVASVAVKSRVDGLITRVHVRDGQEVGRGELLFQLDPKPFEAQIARAQADLARDEAQLDHALVQERRYKELLAQGFVSSESYAQVAANLRTLESTVKAGESEVNRTRINLGYATLRAAISGRIGKVLLSEGNLVKANDTNALLIINQLAPIYVSFALPEQHLDEIRANKTRQAMRVEARLDDGRLLHGDLAFADNSVDTTTGTIRLRGFFANADKSLWPGQFVDTWITLREDGQALVIPAQAVQTGPKGQYVYVVNADSNSEMRAIVISRTDGEEAVIASGLKAGETVVIDGASRLLPGSRVSVKSADKPS